MLHRNIVDASSLRDIREASVYENYALPKLYIKQYYCVEAAVHQRIVRYTAVVVATPPSRVLSCNTIHGAAKVLDEHSSDGVCVSTFQFQAPACKMSRPAT